ncbi:MAG TPA: hypothetical protein ENK56_01850 [Chloroflexi bacterium]|nr:hypothetical protein [Chloroflexota bacterium]
MTRPVASIQVLRAFKPTLDTPFHIDYGWWERSGLNLRVYLQSHLCPEHRKLFADLQEVEEIDWVDEETAEVTRVDGLRHVLRTHCSKQPGYITPHTTLVDAIFRVFLANDNKPLTPVELGQRIGRDPMMILRALSRGRVYKGLRPVVDA